MYLLLPLNFTKIYPTGFDGNDAALPPVLLVVDAALKSITEP